MVAGLVQQAGAVLRKHQSRCPEARFDRKPGKALRNRQRKRRMEERMGLLDSFEAEKPRERRRPIESRALERETKMVLAESFQNEEPPWGKNFTGKGEIEPSNHRYEQNKTDDNLQRYVMAKAMIPATSPWFEWFSVPQKILDYDPMAKIMEKSSLLVCEGKLSSAASTTTGTTMTTGTKTTTTTTTSSSSSSKKTTSRQPPAIQGSPTPDTDDKLEFSWLTLGISLFCATAFIVILIAGGVWYAKRYGKKPGWKRGKRRKAGRGKRSGHDRSGRRSDPSHNDSTQDTAQDTSWSFMTPPKDPRKERRQTERVKMENQREI